MKGYTDFEQSRKLTKILPIESADMFWIHVEEKSPKINFWKVETIQRNFKPYSMDIPCWSLAALLDVLPEGIIENYYVPNLQKENGKYSIAYGNDELLCMADNPVDACYEMILKLHELKML